MNNTEPKNPAIDVLMVELNRLGGVVFAHWILRQNPKTATTVESMEFLDQMFSGKILEKDKWLEPYLSPMFEVADAIAKIDKPSKKKEPKA